MKSEIFIFLFRLSMTLTADDKLQIKMNFALSSLFVQW